MSPSAKYLASAWLPSNYPPADRPEVAMAGRSNAGKSSFLNALFGQKLAKVSGTPGKTRSLNFFDYGPHYRWVDMPGYGFAARGKQEKEAWSKAIETYLDQRSTLCGLVLIMDVRREWTAEEDLLIQWCGHYDKPALVVLSKADKLSRSQGMNRKAQVGRQSGVPVFLISSLKKTGLEEAERYIFENWVQNRLQEGEA
jgi:GTP-binding protein